jgi:tripartite-type tricarboxylate transporter receptor subunit TctC
MFVTGLGSTQSKMRRRVVQSAMLSACAAVLFPFGTAQAQAQAGFKPTAPVKIVVMFPPGGGTDAVARIVGEKLSERWKQPVVVENRAGAQGNIGTAYGAKSPADGNTLVFAHQGVFTVNPHLYKDMGVNPVKDLLPVARLTQQPYVLVAHPSLPVNNLKELEALAKSQPGKISFGSSASGPQLAVEYFKYTSGIDLLHVPYKGAGPAVIDVLGGNINLLVANPASVAPHVKAGKLKGLVLFGAQGVDALPGVPTAIEAGFPALADIPEWYGLAVPAGTPSAVVQQLNQDITAVLADPQVIERIKGLGLSPAPSSSDVFSAQIRRDYERWGDLIKRAGIQAN